MPVTHCGGARVGVDSVNGLNVSSDTCVRELCDRREETEPPMLLFDLRMTECSCYPTSQF